MKPVLFLDIDGVLIPYDPFQLCRPREGLIEGTEWTDWEEHIVAFREGEKLVALSAEMGTQLASLDVEIRWLTTWNPKANTIGSLLGLPESGYAALPLPFGSRPWKLHAVKDFVEEEPGRPFIWVDDDDIHSWDLQWGRELGTPNLMIPTHTEIGLTPEHIETMRVFVSENSVVN